MAYSDFQNYLFPSFLLFKIIRLCKIITFSYKICKNSNELLKKLKLNTNSYYLPFHISSNLINAILSVLNTDINKLYEEIFLDYVKLEIAHTRFFGICYEDSNCS